MKKIVEYLKLIRIKHYLKNVLIFLPLIFSGNVANLDKLTTSILGFVTFCLTASIVYIINDIKDVESDKLHEVKKNRPLASGSITKKEAILLATVFTLLVVAINILFLKTNIVISSGLILLYFLINIAYSFGLKNKPIIDIAILTAGFLLRVLYGSAITNIEISNWLYLTIISGSFYMGLGKRRNEIIKNGSASRKVLSKYTKEFLDKNMYMFLSLCIVFYSLWSVDANTIGRINNGNLLIWTVPIVMIILLKYSLNIEGDTYGDPVDVIFSDKVLLTIIAIFAMFLFALIYII